MAFTKKPKFPKGIDETFVEEVERASPEDLKNRIVNLQNGIEQATSFLKSPKVQDLKDAYDEVAGPTRDTKTACKNKTKFIIDELRKRGELSES